MMTEKNHSQFLFDHDKNTFKKPFLTIKCHTKSSLSDTILNIRRQYIHRQLKMKVFSPFSALNC